MSGSHQGQPGQQQGGLQGGGGGGGGVLPPPNPHPQYMQQLYAQQALAEELRGFWAQMRVEVDEHSDVLADFKNQQLPLARIKKIMKSDEDVRMISAEAPVLFARACEFFIQELTTRSWSAAQEYKRRTLQRSDVATAISRTDIFDFLVDIVPREEANEPANDGTGQGQAQGGAPAAPAPALQPLPLAMYGQAPGQQGQPQQQFLAAAGQQQFMQATQQQQQQQFLQAQQQGGAARQGGGSGMMGYSMPFMAPPFAAYQLGAPSQQAPGMQFPPQQ